MMQVNSRVESKRKWRVGASAGGNRRNRVYGIMGVAMFVFLV